MEARTCLNSLLFSLLSLSILVTGCSRQLHTELVSSDGAFNRHLASLFSSPSMSEGMLSEENSQVGKGSSSLVANGPSDSASEPKLGDSHGMADPGTRLLPASGRAPRPDHR